MIIKFQKKTVFHYIIIYFLIMVNQSCLYEYFLDSSFIRIGILMMIMAAIILKFRHTYVKYLLIAAALLLTTAVTRFVSGGIGIMAWVGWVIPILLCVYAINYDIENFLKRLVTITVFLAAIGLVLFLIQITMPELLKTLLISEYNTKFSVRTWSDAFTYQSHYQKGYGLLFYSFRDSGDSVMRNKGVFTEPGVCQMLYNASVFLLLFCPDKLKITSKKMKRYLMVLIVAVITVQSTTGYTVLGIMLVSYLVSRQREKKSFRKYMWIVVSLGVSALMADWFVRGGESFLNVAILQKIFGDNHAFEIQLSGQVRIGATLLSLRTMLMHPFGVGADQLSALLAADQMAGGGAGILKFGAMSGFIPFLIMTLFYAVPIIKAGERVTVKLLLLLFIFSTLLAQTMPFYPMLILFPIYFMESRNRAAVHIHKK